MANGYFERGEVYWVKFGDTVGSEEAAGRPGVIISSKKGNETSSVVIVAYTTRQVKYGVINPSIYATGERTYVMCNQIQTVDKTRLGRLAGVLTDEEMRSVDNAIETALDLGYVDDTLVKQKDSEIADRDVLIGDLRNEVAGAKTEINKKDEEIASLKMEIEMWQKCYGRCMDMLVDVKVNADVARRTKVEPPTEKQPEESPKVEEKTEMTEDLPPVVEESVVEDRLDINSCTATALKKVGFSLAVARRIVESRPFKRVEDLKRVNGVKGSLYRVLEPKLCCVVVEPNKEDDPVFERVNINAASAKEISEISGIHISTCHSIVGYRKKNGPYTKLEDLLSVHGVYPGTLKKCGDMIEFGEVAQEIEEAPREPEKEPTGKVNVNTASAQEIHDITGLSLTACFAITGKRKRDGLYTNLDELVIPGRLSEATLANYRDKMEV